MAARRRWHRSSSRSRSAPNGKASSTNLLARACCSWRLPRVRSLASTSPRSVGGGWPAPIARRASFPALPNPTQPIFLSIHHRIRRTDRPSGPIARGPPTRSVLPDPPRPANAYAPPSSLAQRPRSHPHTPPSSHAAAAVTHPPHRQTTERRHGRLRGGDAPAAPSARVGRRQRRRREQQQQHDARPPGHAAGAHGAR